MAARGVTARLALAGDESTDWRMPEFPAQPPAAHPFLIMNPKSGGGKVGRFDLKHKAEGLGAEVFLMDGPEEVDVAAVARDAVARGADLLGVAGGDGTEALLAGVAAEHGIPFVVITAGTGITLPSISGWTARTLRRALTRCPMASNCTSTWGDRRPDVRQQRLLRRLRRSRADPGVPRRQDEDDAGAASGPAARS